MAVRYEARKKVLHGVRWNAALGEFELRCEDCVDKGASIVYWPLLTTFWEPRRLLRCRACRKEMEARNARTRYRSDPAPKRAKNAAYQRTNQPVLNLKRRTGSERQATKAHSEARTAI